MRWAEIDRLSDLSNSLFNKYLHVPLVMKDGCLVRIPGEAERLLSELNVIYDDLRAELKGDDND